MPDGDTVVNIHLNLIYHGSSLRSSYLWKGGQKQKTEIGRKSVVYFNNELKVEITIWNAEWYFINSSISEM